MSSSLILSMPAEDIAQLTFDMPGKGANVLSKGVLEEFSTRLDELEALAAKQPLIGLIIASAKPGIFIAGADLREFAASLDIPTEETVKFCRQGQNLFGRLSQLPFVTVAVIDGICVGGGAELAVWCDRRVMTTSPKCEIGFPEVKLGLFPGWGGTARTPRIIGLANAVEMVTSGESISPKAAYANGLATEAVASDRLLEACMNLVREEAKTKQYLADREAWRQPIAMNETELGFLAATASAYIESQTKGQYPAPLAALETMLGAAGVDIDAACQMEAEGMAQLFGSPINRALLNVFFLTDRNKKDRGIDRDDIQPAKTTHAGVIGAGIMGAGIAAAGLRRGLHIVLTDANEAALEKGARGALEEASYNRELGKADLEKTLELAPRLRATANDADFAPCQVVIEAIIEKLDAKRDLYARLEPHLGANAVLATNTSTIPITKLAEKLKHPERFCGIHFFNPVRKMKLVEVIRGEKTSDETVAAAVALAKHIGKSPIVVGDGPGFLVNRLLFPYMAESLALLQQGVAMKHIESAAKRFGMPMGPLELYDMVGLDTALYAGTTMYEAFPERTLVSPILPAMVKAGRLGQKNGRGFFSYDNKKKKPQPDPAADALLATYIEPAGKELARDEITSRLFLPMLLEATRVLEEKIARDVRDIDLGLIFGIGFPPFRGGLMFWADTLGAAKIVEELRQFTSLGERFQPTPLLLKMANEDKKFYEMK